MRFGGLDTLGILGAPSRGIPKNTTHYLYTLYTNNQTFLPDYKEKPIYFKRFQEIFLLTFRWFGDIMVWRYLDIKV